MAQPTTKLAQAADRSVAFQYVQQQVARDMAVLYKAFGSDAVSKPFAAAKVIPAEQKKRTSR